MERYRRLIRAHVYDKCWQLDITWAEVEQLLDEGDVVEETGNEGQIKRVRFLEGWTRPLHIRLRPHPTPEIESTQFPPDGEGRPSPGRSWALWRVPRGRRNHEPERVAATVRQPTTRPSIRRSPM